MKLNIGDRSLSKISKQKKNAFIWFGLTAMVFAFVLAIYNGIDMESAIKTNREANKVLDNPDLNEHNKTTANTKIAWAIDIENTIDSMEEQQKKVVDEMVQTTKKQIMDGNGIVLTEIERTYQLLKNKMGKMENDNYLLKKELKNLKTQQNSQYNKFAQRMDAQQNDLENMIEDGVMLPPPPLNSQPAAPVINEDTDSLFSKINIVDTVKKVIPKQVTRKDYKVISFKNDFADVNDTVSVELTEEEILAQNTYEVITGFTDAYLLTGAYVPLFGGVGGGGSSAQSIPVLMETSGDLLMPNKTIGSIDKCFLLGVSTGNPGARSVEIRLDKMTCLVAGGKKVLQGEIDGYIVSETGSTGLPATMIYKAGDFISRMIGAGILEGLSTAVVNMAAGNNNGIGGGTQIYGDTMTGAGNGMSNAFTKLADFYLELAEATIPILEVKPGRFISAVLIGGNKFELKDINLLDTREIDSYIDDFIGDE